jgi:hypothetical protein
MRTPQPDVNPAEYWLIKPDATPKATRIPAIMVISHYRGDACTTMATKLRVGSGRIFIICRLRYLSSLPRFK